MRRSHPATSVLLGLSALIAVAACAPAQPSAGLPPQTDGLPGEAARPRGTLKIAWPTEPETLHPKLSGGRGLNEFFWVFNSFLTYYDFAGVSHPMMAREIPSQENGDWVINADGSMVTTYRLRPNLRWHDGSPLTAADFILGFEVALDPDVPIRDRTPEVLMSAVEAPDPHTLVVRWKEPSLAANRLTYQELSPLPRHLVEDKYRTNRANFIFGEEWTSAYVGNGPYRLERWNPGAGLIARAYTDWALGPPRVDVLDIRFITDARTQVANLLAGEVDLINSPGVEPSDAAAVLQVWGTGTAPGYVKTWTRNIRYMEFQYREVPNWQRAVTDLRVRQAIMHATDRQGLLQVVSHGLGQTADTFLGPTEPTFPEAERVITKYPYDPTRAAALLADAGWRASRPGEPVTNSGGATLDVQLWTTSGGDSEPEAAVIGDGWKTAGINSSISILAAAVQRDNELRVSFPAVNLSSRGITLDNFVFTSANHPTAETRWQGSNRGSFSDTDVERLQHLVLTSFVAADQNRAVIALQKRMTELVGIAPLYYGTGVILARNRLKGPVGEVAQKSGMSWNIFDWEIAE